MPLDAFTNWFNQNDNEHDAFADFIKHLDLSGLEEEKIVDDITPNFDNDNDDIEFDSDDEVENKIFEAELARRTENAMKLFNKMPQSEREKALTDPFFTMAAYVTFDPLKDLLTARDLERIGAPIYRAILKALWLYSETTRVD